MFQSSLRRKERRQEILQRLQPASLDKVPVPVFPAMEAPALAMEVLDSHNHLVPLLPITIQP